MEMRHFVGYGTGCVVIPITAFNIFQVYQYFTIYSQYFLLKIGTIVLNILYNTKTGKSYWYRPLLKGLYIVSERLVQPHCVKKKII